MKTVSLVAIVGALMSSAAIANTATLPTASISTASSAATQAALQAPAMRGEITEVIIPQPGIANLLQTSVQGLPTPNISGTAIITQQISLGDALLSIDAAYADGFVQILTTLFKGTRFRQHHPKQIIGFHIISAQL